MLIYVVAHFNKLKNMSSKLIFWFKKKDNYIYVLMLIVGIIIASYKYSFISAIIGFGIIILFGILLGFLIRLFI